MGLRGPQPMTDVAVKMRGSHAKLQRKYAAVPSTPSYPKRRTPRTPSPGDVETICREELSYDPWRDSKGFRFDRVKAQLAIKWFHKHLIHVKGELGGKAFRLERWQMSIVGNLFGWFGPKGYRRYKKAFIFVPRKNGKTPFSAGLATYLFVADDEPGAEIYSAASTRDQARLVWTWAKGMIRGDKLLDETCKIFTHAITKVNDEMASYRPVAAEAGGLHGLNSHGIVVDELHTFTKVNEEVIYVLETSVAARRQPLIVMITTAGWDRNSICYKRYDYAKRVLAGDDGYCDPTFLPVIYEAEVEDDWTDERVWRKANPNFGVSVKEDYFRIEFERARKDASYENRFRQLHLNQWTEQSVRWIRMDDWDKCGVKFDLADLDGRKCYGGFDLGITRDLTALSLAFPDADGGVTIALWHWIPDVDARKREEIDKVPYRQWAKAGLVEMTPGNVTDLECIEKRILELKDRFDIQEIGFDPYQAVAWAAKMQERHGIPMIKVSQGILSISEPAQNFHKLVLDGKLRHGGNPMLRWQAGNVEVYIDPNDNVKPSKSSESNRIDGIIATIMALKLALLDNGASGDYNVLEPIVLDF